MAKGRKPPKGGGGVDNSIPKVTGLTATVVYTNNVYLKWNILVGATTYWIYRNNVVIAIIPPVEYTDAGPLAHGTYTYEVAPVVNSTLGPRSLPAIVTI